MIKLEHKQGTILTVPWSTEDLALEKCSIQGQDKAADLLAGTREPPKAFESIQGPNFLQQALHSPGLTAACLP